MFTFGQLPHLISALKQSKAKADVTSSIKHAVWLEISEWGISKIKN